MYVVNLNKEINMNDCPNKLEPTFLTSVLKNVPVDMMWKLREYHSKPSHFEIKWKARQPVEGKKYGYGGGLKWEDAQSGDMYVKDLSLESKYKHLQDINKKMTDSYMALDKEYKDLLADHNYLISLDGEAMPDDEDWKTKYDHMCEDADREYKELTLKYNKKYKECIDLRDKYDQLWHDMLRGVNQSGEVSHQDMVKEVHRHAIREECDGVDYEAVTKGIKGLINLLRR